MIHPSHVYLLFNNSWRISRRLLIFKLKYCPPSFSTIVENEGSLNNDSTVEFATLTGPICYTIHNTIYSGNMGQSQKYTAVC